MTPISKQPLFAIIATYLIWGFFPIFWKQLQHVDTLEVLAHRMIWGCLVLLAYLQWRYGGRWIKPFMANPKLLWMLCFSGFLITINWYVFVWATANGRIADAGLGYYINPLINILFAFFFFKEPLNRWQTMAILCAFVGVMALIVHYGETPWVGIVIALSFGSYSVMKRIISAEAVSSLTVEGLFFLIPAIIYVMWLAGSDAGNYLHYSWKDQILLFLAGLFTVIPLILFSYGVPRISFALLGILQFMTPTLHLVCAVLLYGEPFDQDRLLGFSFIWLGVLIFIGNNWRQKKGVVARSEVD